MLTRMKFNDDAILGPDDQKREAGIELVKEYEKIQEEDLEE
jgi:diacylglycerol kinase (ATP)